MRIVLIGLLVLSWSGCGTVYMDAPPKGVRLLARDAPAEVRVQRTVWFKWWGNAPKSDNHAASMIEAEGLKEARVTMTNTAADSIIGVFTGIVGFPRRSLIVEGNR